MPAPWMSEATVEPRGGGGAGGGGFVAELLIVTVWTGVENRGGSARVCI